MSNSSETLTQGHVALYARGPRWLRTTARSLAGAGHSCREAASPAELRRLLLSQRFDVLVARVSNEQDGNEVATALHGVALPPHAIQVGGGTALGTPLRSRRRGTLRYVPGRLPGPELSRLVDISIRAGTWEELCADGGDAHDTEEEVDMEEAIERAASSVYAHAKRRRQRFRTLVEGPTVYALAHPERLQRTLSALLELLVDLAPNGAVISVEAKAGDEDWTVRLSAFVRNRRFRVPAGSADSLCLEKGMLARLSRDIERQGGLLWVELMGPDALSLCFTLRAPATTRVAM